MRSLTRTQAGAHAVLNSLYLDQCLVEYHGAGNRQDSVMEVERGWLEHISRRVHLAISQSGSAATQLDVEKLGHFVFVLLEIETADIDVQIEMAQQQAPPTQAEMLRILIRYRQTHFADMSMIAYELGHGATKAQVSAALEIAQQLKDEVRRAPATVRLRLANRVMVYNHPEAPLEFLAWMNQLGILKTGKYRAGRDSQPIDECARTRLHLYCSLAALRRKIESAGKQEHSPSGYLNNVLNTSMRELYVGDDLRELEKERFKANTFKLTRAFAWRDIEGPLALIGADGNIPGLHAGTSAGWVGALGAVLVGRRQRLHPGEAVFYNADPDCEALHSPIRSTSHVKAQLNSLGFAFSTRQLNDGYGELKSRIWPRVLGYHTIISGLGIALDADLQDAAMLILRMSEERCRNHKLEPTPLSDRFLEAAERVKQRRQEELEALDRHDYGVPESHPTLTADN